MCSIMLGKLCVQMSEFLKNYLSCLEICLWHIASIFLANKLTKIMNPCVQNLLFVHVVEKGGK